MLIEWLAAITEHKFSERFSYSPDFHIRTFYNRWLWSHDSHSLSLFFYLSSYSDLLHFTSWKLYCSTPPDIHKKNFLGLGPEKVVNFISWCQSHSYSFIKCKVKWERNKRGKVYFSHSLTLILLSFLS